MPVGRVMGPVEPRAAMGAVAITPKEIVDILRRHILLIVSLTVLGLIVSGVAWYLLLKYAPKYTAKTYIKVLPPVEKDPMTIGGGEAAANLQYEHRRSLATVITRQSNLEELVSRDKVKDTEWFKRFGESKAISAPKAIKNLNKNFIAYAEMNTDYIMLAMTCNDKYEASLIVNEMVDLFLASQRVTATGEVSDKLTTLNEQLKNINDALRDAEKSLTEVRESSKFTDFETHAIYESTYTVKVNDLEQRQSALILDIQRNQAIIENYSRQVKGPIDDQLRDMIERDSTVTALTGQIASLETELAGRQTKFGENHRVVRQLQEMIDVAQRKREDRKLEIANQTRQANLKNAQDNLAVLQVEYEQLENLRQQAINTKKDYDLARVLYEQRKSIKDQIRARRDDTEQLINKFKIMYDDPETPKVKFLGYAPVPLAVSSPQWIIYFPGGTVLGLMFGIGLAFLIEMLNDLVRTPRDVTRYLHIPLLGIIPDVSEDDQAGDVDIHHVVQQAPYSIIAESYRRLRTNLKLSGSTSSSKTFLSAAVWQVTVKPLSRLILLQLWLLKIKRFCL